MANINTTFAVWSFKTIKYKKYLLVLRVGHNSLFPRPFILAMIFLGTLFQNCIEARSQDRQDNGKSDDFSTLDYNHPELSVDLGVGLWGWPLPMDFDDDGDMDLAISCPDTPLNGTYFFEHTSNGPSKMPNSSCKK